MMINHGKVPKPWDNFKIVGFTPFKCKTHVKLWSSLMDRRILRRRITTLQSWGVGPHNRKNNTRISLESSHPVDRIWTFQRYSH
jgi:hypothetical protein